MFYSVSCRLPFPPISSDGLHLVVGLPNPDTSWCRVVGPVLRLSSAGNLDPVGNGYWSALARFRRHSVLLRMLACCVSQSRTDLQNDVVAVVCPMMSFALNQFLVNETFPSTLVNLAVSPSAQDSCDDGMARGAILANRVVPLRGSRGRALLPSAGLRGGSERSSFRSSREPGRVSASMLRSARRQLPTTVPRGRVQVSDEHDLMGPPEYQVYKARYVCISMSLSLINNGIQYSIRYRLRRQD